MGGKPAVEQSSRGLIPNVGSIPAGWSSRGVKRAGARDVGEERGQRGRQHLDGDGAIDHGVARLLHLGHATNAKKPLELIVSQPLASQRAA
jgi:hypothetical protein